MTATKIDCENCPKIAQLLQEIADLKAVMLRNGLKPKLTNDDLRHQYKRMAEIVHFIDFLRK